MHNKIGHNLVARYVSYDAALQKRQRTFVQRVRRHHD